MLSRLSTAGPATFMLAAATLCAASPAALAQYTVQVSVAGDGVVTSENVIACGNGQTKCQFTTKAIGGVTLLAKPAAPDSFVGWSGKCTPNGQTCFVPIYGYPAKVVIKAKFTGLENSGGMPFQHQTKMCPPYCPRIPPVIPQIPERGRVIRPAR